MIIFSCVPKVVKQDGRNYRIIDWDGGNFVFITYQWKGQGFQDAVEIYKKMDELKKSRNLDEQAFGRFSSGKVWQIGFLAKAPVDVDSINGYKLEEENFPSGKYASLILSGYPENTYMYWQTFKKWLERDGYKIESPVLEIYQNDTFNNNIPETKRNGELRYKVSK